MKKFIFAGVCILFAAALFGQSATVYSANRKTAERCLNLAENCIVTGNWNGAFNQAELGISYDNSISDLYYVKANAQSKMGYKRAEVLKTINEAFALDKWVNYNKTGARILYADLLSDTKEYDKALSIINSEPFIYSADAEFIRIKTLYRMGTADSIRQARNKLSSSRKIYPSDERFPQIFFLFETMFMENAERNGTTYTIPEEVQHIAENYIVHFPDYSKKDVQMEIMASMFSSGERQKRLIKAIGEKNQNDSLYALAALKAGVITEEKAYNLFFNNVNVYYLGIFESFVSLITDPALKANLYDHLNAFDGTLVIDEDLDLCNELIVKYNRGRPETIYYDENNDEVLELLCSCDFGVPFAINYENTGTELKYDIYPVVKEVNVKAENTLYKFIDDDLAYTPFEMLVNPPFTKNGVEFFIPYVSKEIEEPEADTLVRRANSIEIPVYERPGATAKYTIYKGVPTLIYFYDNGREYAFANLESGYPFVRYVDYDNDNQFETSEVYDYDEEGKFASEMDVELIVKTFGNISLTENLYLKKVEIDRDNDTILDFKEEYIGYGGKISSWDLDGNGIWDTDYIRYPLDEQGNLKEETVIYSSNGLSKIVVSSTNGKPDGLVVNNKVLPLEKGVTPNYYWIDGKGSADEEALIYATVGDKTEIARVQIVSNKEKRFSVIRIGNNYFCKLLAPSMGIEFEEFVHE